MMFNISHIALKLHDRCSNRQIVERLRELNYSQWHSRDEQMALQRLKIRQLVDYAYHHVPYYHRVFNSLGFTPADLLTNFDCFYQLPIVTKKMMRANPQDFLTTHPRVRKTLRPHSTSGSTGEPFTFWEDHTCRDVITADLLRHLTWSGWQLGEPHAYLWGLPFEESLSTRLRNRLMNLIFNRFYINAYLLHPQNLAGLAKQIIHRKTKVLFGYPTALVAFAKYVQENHPDKIRLKAVFAAGEVLYPHYRTLLQETFGCSVFDRYGTNEFGGVACECEEHRGLHISMEHCLVEVVANNRPVPNGQAGEILVTNLDNYGFPFIRYRLADTVKTWGRRCPCGRPSPMLQCVQGRTVDLFKTNSGGAVWGDLEGTIFQVDGIRQSQVIQKTVDTILVRLVTDHSFEHNNLQKIEQIIKKMMGNTTQVKFEFPDHIPRLKSGKFRYSYSELPQEHHVSPKLITDN